MPCGLNQPLTSSVRCFNVLLAFSISNGQTRVSKALSVSSNVWRHSTHHSCETFIEYTGAGSVVPLPLRHSGFIQGPKR